MNRKETRAALLKAAQDVIAKAKAEGRSLTAEEVADLEGKSAEIKALDAEIALAEKGDALVQAIGGFTPDEKHEQPTAIQAKSLGEHFVKHAAKRLAEIRGIKGASVAAPEFKANTDAQATGGHSGSLAALLTTVDRTIVQAFRRPTITDLFGTGTLSGQAITYFVEGAREGNFGTVAEGGAKPQLHYANPTPVTDALSKIAGFIKLTDEMIEDLDFLVSEINGRLLYDLGLTEEAQVLNGNGTSPNLRGLLNRSGLQTETAADRTDNADALYRAITKVQLATGLSADGLVINPADYQNLRLSKDANGQYFGGGFFAGQYGQGGIEWQPPVWGLRTVVTPAVAAGSPLVGAFQQGGTVYRKGGVRVESTNSHDTDFTSNLVTVRAEERVALAVRRPSAFVVVTLSDDAPDEG